MSFTSSKSIAGKLSYVIKLFCTLTFFNSSSEKTAFVHWLCLIDQYKQHIFYHLSRLKLKHFYIHKQTHTHIKFKNHLFHNNKLFIVSSNSTKLHLHWKHKTCAFCTEWSCKNRKPRCILTMSLYIHILLIPKS